MPAPRIHSALVVFKKSAFDLYVAGGAAGAKKIPDAATRRVMLTAHENNARCIDEVKRVLDESGVKFRLSSRADLHPSHTTNGIPDLVIPVGGDGTFLEASHLVTRGLIMGVNSSPDHSVGFFCTATRETFADRLHRALDGRLAITPMSRLQVDIEGVRVPHLALNDVLITHQNPGATSRYVLKIGGREETQRSSGVWIATAAGSTAGIRTAGGALLPIRTKKLQYAVREIFTPPGERKPKLLRGAVDGPRGIRLVSRMADGAIFVDGPRHLYPLHIGTRVSVKTGAIPLRVLGFDHARRR